MIISSILFTLGHFGAEVNNRVTLSHFNIVLARDADFLGNKPVDCNRLREADTIPFYLRQESKLEG